MMSTVLPTPAPPNIAALPPFTSGASRSITLMPVRKIERRTQPDSICGSRLICCELAGRGDVGRKRRPAVDRHSGCHREAVRAPHRRPAPRNGSAGGRGPASPRFEAGRRLQRDRRGRWRDRGGRAPRAVSGSRPVPLRRPSAVSIGGKRGRRSARRRRRRGPRRPCRSTRRPAWRLQRRVRAGGTAVSCAPQRRIRASRVRVGPALPLVHARIVAEPALRCRKSVRRASRSGRASPRANDGRGRRRSPRALRASSA